MSETYGELGGSEFGPPVRGRTRRRHGGWRRVLMLSTAAVAVFSVGLVATAGALFLRGEGQIDRVEVEGIRAAGDIDGDGDVDVEELTESLNVLVVGSDAREGLTDDQRRELATGQAGGLRTDTIMLVRVNPRNDQVAILSFPRDLLVELCDGSASRINAAYAVGEANGTGGPSCLLQTVTNFTGIPIQHYVQVNFAGFVEVVDIVGGVTMYLEEPMEDPKAGLDLPAGCVTLDGAEALGFVRTRRYDSDYGRIARQQRFIKELVAEATSVGTLANVPRLFSLVDAAAGAIEADHDLSLSVMRRLAMSLRNLSSDRLVARTVPAATHEVNGLYAGELPLDEEAEELFHAFRHGDLIAPPAAGRQRTVELRPSDVEALEVLNGAGTSGLAATAQQHLVDLGFQVAATGNADSFDVSETEVHYSPELRSEAEVVADALDGPELVEDQPGSGLRVVLGADFDPARVAQSDQPGATEEAAPEPTATPEPTPTPTYIGARTPDVDC